MLNKSFKFAFIPNLSSKIPKIKITKIKINILKFKIEFSIKFKYLFAKKITMIFKNKYKPPVKELHYYGFFLYHQEYPSN